MAVNTYIVGSDHPELDLLCLLEVAGVVRGNHLQQGLGRNVTQRANTTDGAHHHGLQQEAGRPCQKLQGMDGSSVCRARRVDVSIEDDE